MSTSEPTEEELRAAYEAEIKRIRVEQVLVENLVTMINLGMRRTGLLDGTADERDPAQVRVAIEAVRAHLPLLDQIAPEQGAAVRQALSQLQLAYVQIGGGPVAGAGEVTPPGAVPPAPGPSTPPSAPGAASGPPSSAPGSDAPDGGDGPGPAQRSGRLWVPGQ